MSTAPRNGPSKPTAYGSAKDLPSYQALTEQIRAFKALTWVVARKQRAQLLEIEREVNRLIRIVDGFYDRLGPRNWIFQDSFNVDDIEQLLNETTDAETAEQRLISLYQDPDKSKWWAIRLRGHDGLRQRIHLIERARDCYDAGQFDTCALLLITVMDGFVNDFEPGERKGLHSRDPEEMGAWDSVVGHHMGLTHAMATFTKTVKKRNDEEVFELYRHGIVHGSIVRYDNVVVATKAWNMLFAVADWATATEKAAQPKEDPVTWSGVWASLTRQATYERHQDAFTPSTLTADDPAFESSGVAVRVSAFLDAWQHRRWGLVAEFKPPILRGDETPGETARHTKQAFERFDLASWSIQTITFDQLSAAAILASAEVNGEATEIRFRMAYFDADGHVAVPDRGEGEWRIAVWAPHSYFPGDHLPGAGDA